MKVFANCLIARFDSKYSMYRILQFTPIPAIRAAASLPMLVMNKINELDDPWVIAMDRAHQAGKLLARVLLAEHSRNRAQNSANLKNASSAVNNAMARPITLVGYGMGARLIFHCLETLAAEGGADARGIVENAVLIGKKTRIAGIGVNCKNVFIQIHIFGLV